MTGTKCPLCPENDFYRYKALSDEFASEYLTILKTPNFLILPDIAPLVEGHLLLIPVHHYLCIGEVLGVHPGEFQELKQHVTAILTQTYGRPVFFEHGSTYEKKAGSSIDHAHIHCLPFVLNKEIGIDSSGSVKNRLYSISELSEYAQKKRPYLYLETNRGRSYVYSLDSDVPSQFWRRSVAAELGVQQWDWRAAMNEELRARNTEMIVRAVEKLKSRVAARV